MSEIIIYTDGAARGNPGPGGWAAIISLRKRVREIGGHEEHTTNNRMEIRAALEALKYLFASDLEGCTAATIHTDSSYLARGATSWGVQWIKNGWISSKKEEVLNRDLWEPLLELLDTIPIRIRWKNIGGHVGVSGNERADRIATAYADMKPIQLYDGEASGYPVDLTSHAGDPGMAAKKGAARARSGQKAYSYVSEVDGVVLTHQSWAECEARVKGRRARFRKALTPSEEADIIRQFS